MLKVMDNKIYLTKGDDGVLPVNVTFGNNEAYTMGENDVLTLSVRKQPKADSPLMMMAASNPGSNRIVIPAAATAEMDAGMYSADIQLTDGAGKHYTIWPDATEVAPNGAKNFENFVLAPEVTA